MVYEARGAQVLVCLNILVKWCLSIMRLCLNCRVFFIAPSEQVSFYAVFSLLVWPSANLLAYKGLAQVVL